MMIYKDAEFCSDIQFWNKVVSLRFLTEMSIL
jgi:hypothetical protein